jgi:hypothetical protein
MWKENAHFVKDSISKCFSFLHLTDQITQQTVGLRETRKVTSSF